MPAGIVAEGKPSSSTEEVVLRFMEALASKEANMDAVVMQLAPTVASMPWNAHLIPVLKAHGFDVEAGSFPCGLSPETKRKLYQSVRYHGFGANPAPFPRPAVSTCLVEFGAPVKFENRIERLAVVRSVDGQIFAKLQLLTACNYGKVYSGIEVLPMGDPIFEDIGCGSKTEARYVATSERVAIKQIDRTTYERHVARRCGQLNEDPIKEVAALQYFASRGGSDHVLPLKCCCADDDSLFAVLPFCDGGDLFSLVEKHARLDHRYARHFFKQLVRGLVRLHALGVAHHDLSLENVLWFRSGSAGKAFIIDLGMAVKTSGPTRTRFLPRRKRRGPGFTTLTAQHHDDDYYAVPTKCGLHWPAKCGKLDYMSPELLNPMRSFDLFAVDVWALGVILYVLLVGSPPFDSSRHEKEGIPHALLIDTDPCFIYVRERRLAELLISWRIYVEPSAIDLLERLLDPEPTTRITIPQIMTHPWLRSTCHSCNSG